MSTCTTPLALTTAALLAATPALGESIFLLEDVGTTQQLSFVDSDSPGNVTNRVAITGLGINDRLQGIDFRPATGELFGLSSEDALYTIDTGTGAASLVGPGFSDTLDGTFFGFDFNPAIDRIRIVSTTDTNFVANPNTGDANVADTTPVFFADGDANQGANPNLIGHGYTNSVPNADSTQLFAVDSGLDILVTQANNAGTLNTVGDLGIDIVDIGEFDIAGEGDEAFLAAIENGEDFSSLFRIDLSTGSATDLGRIGDGLTIAGLAVVNGPEGDGGDGPNVIPSPAALPAGALMLAGLVARRRRG